MYIPSTAGIALIAVIVGEYALYTVMQPMLTLCFTVSEIGDKTFLL